MTSSDRIKKMMAGLEIEKYPICIEKARLMTESYRQTKGEPEVLRRAKALAHMLAKITIFIGDGELIVGNAASKYMGVEMEFNYGPWPEDEIMALADEGWLITDDALKEAAEMNEFWRGNGLVTRIGRSFDDERLWPFMQTGIIYAPWKTKEEGSGGGYAESGMGLGPGFYNVVYDYEKVLTGGLTQLIEEAKQELKELRFLSPGSVEKGYFLNAMVICLKAVIGFAERFAVLASDMAKKETDAQRKGELEKIAASCRQVPANPAQNFSEAMQSFWFIYLMMCPSPTSGIGRMDQFMFPFYKKDVDAGLITDEEVLEYLQCLRIKDMEINRISGVANRQKNAGRAKWHNCTIGGQTTEGKDASNALSYLILEAAMRCPTPHHTITLRVHSKTPEPLMVKAAKLVKTGIGMPAFIGDKSYMGYFMSHGVPFEDASDYAMAGCIDAAIPGRSVMNAVAFYIIPTVLEVTFNNGIFPKTGEQVGPKTGDPATFTSFDQLMDAFRTQMTYFMEFYAEYNNLWVKAHQEGFPDPLRTALLNDPVTVGKNLTNRPYLFDNLCVINVVGMINAADSLTAVKKLVFEEKRWTMKEMLDALAANWEGWEEMRKACLAAPKYGNGVEDADQMAADIYRHLADTAVTYGNILGGSQKPSGISISAQGPGGAQTGATPDGRYAGEYLADGAVSPVQGADTNGPTAVIRSAACIDHTPYQATLFNMKFHPSALKGDEDLRKVTMLIRTYFEMGGKHVQFNVVDRETLIEARKEPEKHKDLIVRVAGYSAYFVNLTDPIQKEIIARSELVCA